MRANVKANYVSDAYERLQRVSLKRTHPKNISSTEQELKIFPSKTQITINNYAQSSNLDNTILTLTPISENNTETYKGI